jgi:hypothetical protein
MKNHLFRKLLASGSLGMLAMFPFSFEDSPFVFAARADVIPKETALLNVDTVNFDRFDRGFHHDRRRFRDERRIFDRGLIDRSFIRDPFLDRGIFDRSFIRDPFLDRGIIRDPFFDRGFDRDFIHRGFI